jgi:Fanconi anemia group M protein
MIDKRLFEQLSRLRAAYPAPVALLLEGDLSFFEERRQPKASWGALAAIAVDMGVTLLPTPSKEATADLLTVLARRAAREHVANGGGGGMRHDVRFKPRTPGASAAQRFAVQGLPGIGDVVSDKLLEHFGSVRRVFAATERELLRVPGVGKGRAKEVAAFLDMRYQGRQGRLVAEEAGDGRPLEEDE